MTEERSALDTYCAEKKQLIERELQSIVASMTPDTLQAPAFRDSLHHAVLRGGKRIRPILGVAVYELFDTESERALAPLCTVELIHTGSLILDDLPCMDNAEKRRGSTTNHLLFGEAVTILTSASLWIETFSLLARVTPKEAPELIRVLGHNIGASGLIQGQLLDLALFNQSTSIKNLEEGYRLKTGTLFVVGVLIGAVLGGANEEERHHLEHFATCFGIAFQIRDDIVDATHSENVSGKDANKDVANQKPTYVSILGLEGAREALQEKIAEAHTHLVALQKNSTMLQALTDDLLTV